MEYLGVEVNQQGQAGLYTTNLLIHGMGSLNFSGEYERVPKHLTLLPRGTIGYHMPGNRAVPICADGIPTRGLCLTVTMDGRTRPYSHFLCNVGGGFQPELQQHLDPNIMWARNKGSYQLFVPKSGVDKTRCRVLTSFSEPETAYNRGIESPFRLTHSRILATALLYT
jgi:hypothetical protein